MNRKYRLLLVVILVILIPAIHAHAGMIGSGSWQNGWVADENGSPFWDNKSWDETTDGNKQLNVGYFMTNTGGFTSGGGPGSAYDYWVTSGGSAVSDFYFHFSGINQATLLTQWAGLRIFNEFGIYPVGDPTARISLLEGSDAPGTQANRTLNGDYGFYFQSVDYFDNSVYKFFYSESSLMTDDDAGNQHFAVFTDHEGNYWLGMEDLPFRGTTGPNDSIGTDLDYNDMIVKISTPVPEPASLLLVLSGLGALVAFRRRRKHDNTD